MEKRKLIPDSIKCLYCGSQLTNEELRNIAEAEGITVAAIENDPTITELMCDKCADSWTSNEPVKRS